jgi:hypothetical protein
MHASTVAATPLHSFMLLAMLRNMLHPPYPCEAREAVKVPTFGTNQSHMHPQKIRFHFHGQKRAHLQLDETQAKVFNPPFS